MDWITQESYLPEGIESNLRVGESFDTPSRFMIIPFFVLIRLPRKWRTPDLLPGNGLPPADHPAFSVLRDAGANPVVGGRIRNKERTAGTAGADHRTSVQARITFGRTAPTSRSSSVRTLPLDGHGTVPRGLCHGCSSTMTMRFREEGTLTTVRTPNAGSWCPGWYRSDLGRSRGGYCSVTFSRHLA